jgi:hypothetical protein
MQARKTLFARLALASAVALGLAACGGDSPTPPVTPTIAVSPAGPFTMTVGQTQAVNVTVTPANTEFTVQSSAAGVATATRAGNAVTITAAGPGTAAITVAVAGNAAVNRVINVTVEAPASPTLTVSPTSVSNLQVGANSNFTVTITGVQNADFSVTSQNTGIASVTKTATGGTITGVAAGSTTVQVAVTGQPTLTQDIAVSVVAAPGTPALTVSPTSLPELQVGQTGTFTVTITGVENADFTVTSQNTAVATVAKTATGGTVTAAGPGTTQIAVAVVGHATVTANVGVTVAEPPAADAPSLAMGAGSPPAQARNPEDEYRFVATAAPGGQLRSPNPVDVSIVRHWNGITGAASCIVGNWANNACEPIAHDGVVDAFDLDLPGYYTITARAVGADGARSPVITRMMSRFQDAPELIDPGYENPPAPSGPNADYTWTIASVEDKFDLWFVDPLVQIEDRGAAYALGPRVQLGTFGPEQYTRTATTVQLKGKWVSAWQVTNESHQPAGSVNKTHSVEFQVWNQAGREQRQWRNFAGLPDPQWASFAGQGVATFRGSSTPATVPANGTFTISAAITGLAPAPIFSRVIIWHEWRTGAQPRVRWHSEITSAGTGSAGNFTWTSGAIQASEFGPGTHSFRVGGVMPNGHALISQPFTVEIQ